MEPKPIIRNCTHRDPTDEQLRHIDISSNNNLLCACPLGINIPNKHVEYFNFLSLSLLTVLLYHDLCHSSTGVTFNCYTANLPLKLIRVTR